MIALAYPALRIADLVPTASILEVADNLNTARAASLKTRFDNEDQLLQHAMERIWFGWGRYGRSRIYNEYGKDVTLSDGGWIIRIGTFGVFGFLAEFGLLALSVFRAASALRFVQSMLDAILLAALGLIVAINLVDSLPNSSISPWTWLLSGALLGRAEAAHAASRRAGACSGQILPNQITLYRRAERDIQLP